MKNKYFTEHERYQLEALLKQKISVQKIAVQMDKSRTTIYNEIKRGTVEFLNYDLTTYKAYDAQYAHNDYLKKAQNKGRELAIGNDLEFVRYAEKMMNEEKYSPYAVLQSVRQKNLNFKSKISLSTFYNYLRGGLFLNVEFKTRKKKEESSRKVSFNNRLGKSIELRPAEVRKRETAGHWELDTVVSGRGGSGVLLVLTERCSRMEIIRKMKDKSSASVVRALNTLERSFGVRKFREMFKTITCDNGSEFLDAESLEKSYCSNQKRTTIYYCHPYCASERGSNENQNKMIRRFVPKGSDISGYSAAYIQMVEDWMNNYPRKIFNGLSSNEYMRRIMTA